MSFSERLSSHLKRLRHQTGGGPVLGQRQFRMAGYFPNRMASDITAHEPHMNGIIAKLLAERPQGFWDVGANIGQTMLKVMAADPGAQYFGFEPQILPAAQIQDFIKRNHLSNCRIFPFALGDRTGCAWLYHASDTDEMASLSETHLARDVRSSTIVLLRKGDEFFRELGSSDMGILKIDAEGAEMQVLRGFEQTIGQYLPVILLEVLPNFVGEARDWLPEDQRQLQEASASELASFLTGFGYRLQVVDRNGTERPVESFNLNDREGFAGYDYVARPASRAS